LILRFRHDYLRTLLHMRFADVTRALLW
jgi:hypothetical protein